MFRAVGSTSLHQAMNDRMTLMMGEQAETRMHQLLGARYAGCRTSQLGIGGGPMTGAGGMMGGCYSNGVGAMMSSGAWSWMMGGTWQHMTRQDWDQLENRLLGTATVGNHSGWSTLAIIAVTLAAVIRATRDLRDHPGVAIATPIDSRADLLIPHSGPRVSPSSNTCTELAARSPAGSRPKLELRHPVGLDQPTWRATRAGSDSGAAKP
ncbi:MAG: hypothetical protein JO286_01870 [Solirubrobacterales bacterium]|nr:hypothetical protein [Solirubrobacterales bacterium]